MAVRQYIGARYVPLYVGDWDATRNYEPLSIVTDANGNSFTSLKDVPAGTQLTNRNYWIQTSSFSGAVDQLTRRVNSIENDLDGVEFITPEQFGAVGDGISDDTTALQTAINEAWNSGRPLIAKGDYRTTAPLYFSTPPNADQIKYYRGASIAIYGSIKADHAGDCLIFDGLFYRCFFKYVKAATSGRGNGIVLRKTTRANGSSVTTYNSIRFGAIHDFAVGILLDVSGNENTGIQYNQIAGELVRCENGTCVKGRSSAAGNWITQCKFSDMRLMGAVDIDFSENLSGEPSTEMIFDNVGLESGTESGVVARNFIGCHFMNIRAAENEQSGYIFDFIDSYDVHVNGHIWLPVDKVRCRFTEQPANNIVARMRKIYFECSRIDLTTNGRFLGTKAEANWNDNLFIQDYAHTEGCYTSLYNNNLDFAQMHMIPAVFNVNNMANDSGRDSKIIVPNGAETFMERIYVKTGFNSGNPFTVEYPDGENALKTITALEANSEYMLLPSPQGFIACKLA